ncbi:MAG: diacylglycerol kinase [Candidatus Colwellbacteria bacterium]
MTSNRRLRDSFKAAFNGFRESLIFERSFKIMAVAAALVIVAMIYFPTSRLEKVVLLAAVLAVLVLELINSAVERIMNVLEPAEDEQVRVIKDLMAAIVLLASIGAAIVGVLILSPYIFNR